MAIFVRSMANSKYTPVLASLKTDLDYYSDYLRGLSREILDAGASKYPVFVATESKNKISIGKNILGAEGLSRTWNINVCLLEELVLKGIVQKDKVDLFTKNFKDPELYMCVLAIISGDASFVFMPYTGAEEEEEI